jgi:hypothetical protein
MVAGVSYVKLHRGIKKMMTYRFDAKFAVILGAIFLLAVSAPAMAQNGPGPGWGRGETTTVEPLTAAESQWLTFMREEEKLARDVYQQLYEKWNVIAFQNIATSEQNHFDAIGVLLTRYGVADPAQNNPAGVYTDANLNALYNELLARGTLSLQDALEVGVLIEQKDIADLETALKDTSKTDIKRVYTNLMNASYNHLDAFETGCSATRGSRGASQ